MISPNSPLALADYRRLCLARASSVMAANGMVIILGYQLYDVARHAYAMDIKHASFQLGLLGLFQFLPMFLLNPVAGVVADRFDRRLVVAVAQGVDLLIAVVLALCAMGQTVSLPLLFALAAAHGAARVFVGPAMSSITPRIVPADLLPRAIAVGSLAFQAGGIAGPALAGLLYAQSAATPYWMAGALLAVSCIALLRIQPVPATASSREVHPLAQAIDGFAYVRANRFLLGCVTLDLFAVLLAGATALLPVYARDILHVGSQGLGQMRATTAVGAAVMGLWLSARPLSRNVGVKMLWAVALFGAGTVVFGISRNYALSLAMLFWLGATDMISVFVRNSLVQLNTPDDMRGRVSAISGLAISASNELGEMESGLLAGLLGATGAVVFGGVAAIGITAAWAWLFPEIRRARSFAPLDPGA